MLRCLLVLLLAAPAALGQNRPAPAPRTTEQQLAYFLQLTDTLRRQTHNPGLAVAIINDRKLLYKGGLGYRNLARKLPVTTNTLFEIGSCTKAFTGVIAAQLVQEKKLSWDDPVRQYLPEFRLADDYAGAHATLRDLFTHRVGLDQHYYLQYGPRISRPALLSKLPYLSFKGTFRENFLYNNLLYTVAGIAEERVTRTSWEELVRTRIFRPLGLNSSFTTFEEFRHHPEPTISYRTDGVTVVPALSLEDAAPAASITSTITDMARWLEMLVNKGTLDGQEFLSPQQFAYLTSPLTVRNPAEEIFYGIGWDVDTHRRIIYHDGRTAGQSSRILLAPDRGFGIVILCNQQTELQNLLIRYATNIFLDGNYDKMADFEQFVRSKAQPVAAVPAPAAVVLQDAQTLAAAQYVGTYTHPAYGTITISRPAKKQLVFAYYDFKGPIRSNGGLSFTALTTHYTGNDQFDFRVLQGPSQQVTGIEVKFPYSQPLVFSKVAAVP